MKTLIFLMYMCYVLPVQPGDMNRYIYCESCLTVAQEIEKAMVEVPAESRGKVAKKLISTKVCEKLWSYKHGQISNEKLVSSCNHLFDSHHDKFQAALMNKEPKNLDIVLCYEQSTACVGVKRMSFKDSKTTFTESDIDALLRDNKENVRITKPTYSGSPAQSRDEL